TSRRSAHALLSTRTTPPRPRPRYPHQAHVEVAWAREAEWTRPCASATPRPLEARPGRAVPRALPDLQSPRHDRGRRGRDHPGAPDLRGLGGRHAWPARTPTEPGAA